MIGHQHGARELYNLEQDPGEQQNLAGAAEFREVADQLYQKIAAIVPEVRSAAGFTQGKQ